MQMYKKVPPGVWGHWEILVAWSHYSRHYAILMTLQFERRVQKL
jgi:hypothetical protein